MPPIRPESSSDALQQQKAQTLAFGVRQTALTTNLSEFGQSVEFIVALLIK
jgi:hypothetical protein